MRHDVAPLPTAQRAAAGDLLQPVVVDVGDAEVRLEDVVTAPFGAILRMVELN